MAGKRGEVQVKITGEADLGQAVKEVQRDFAKMERASEATVREIEQAFAGADLEVELDKGALVKAERDFDAFAAKLGADGVDVAVDLTDLRRAFDLADQLDAITASIDIDTDISELQQAEALARNLRNFTGRIGLDVEGTNELREALGLAENLDQLRQVKIDVQGRQDLERAEAIARDLDGKRVSIPIEADTTDLVAGIEQAGAEAGESFTDGFDITNVGGSLAGGLTDLVGAVGPWGAAAAAVGAVFADDFAAGFESEWSQARGNVVLAVRSGLSDTDLEEVGRVAGDVYADGLGESLGSVRDTAALIQQELGTVDDGLDLTEATRQAEALAEVFGTDVADSVAVVDKLVSQDLVANTQEGFNLLADLGQQTGAQFDEVIDVANEFSNALAGIGIDGPQGLYLIGTAIEEGIFPQVDQAGEVFEEFQETLRSGGSAEALDEIGLSAELMQQKLADGRGAEAMAEIADALLALPDPAQRAALAAEIFGGNMALASDPDRALELFATADAVREVGTSASDAADDLEGTRTSLDKVKQGFFELGETAASALDGFLSGGQVPAATTALDGLAESFLGIENASATASDFLNDVTFGLLGASDGADELGPKLGSTSDALAKTGDDAADAAGGVSDLAGEVVNLDDALAAFSGRFDDDQVFRSIEADSAAAVEAVTGLTSAAYDLGTGFDISTEAGRKAEASLEDLSGNLDDLIEGYQNSTITAEQLAEGQDAVEAAVRAVAAQMGATAAETEAMVATYATVPDDINTNVGLTDNATTPVNKVREKLEELTNPRRATVEVTDNATSPLQKIKDKLDAIRSKTVTVTTVTSSIRGLEGRASGGPVQAGRQYLVGERGPELVVFPDDGYVLDAQATARIQSAADTDPARALTPVASPGGPGKVVNFNGPIVTPPGRDLWEQLRHTELVYAEL